LFLLYFKSNKCSLVEHKTSQNIYKKGLNVCIYVILIIIFILFQEKQRSTFFSIFYLSINAGSLLSTLITPILRCVYFVQIRIAHFYIFCYIFHGALVKTIFSLCIFLMFFSSGVWYLHKAELFPVGLWRPCSSHGDCSW